MAIAFRAAAHGTGGSSCQATIPATTQPGDVILAYAAATGTVGVFDDPDGFARLEDPIVVSGDATCLAYVKVADANDPGRVVTLGTDGGAGMKTGLGLVVYSGTDQANPVMAHAALAETASTTTHAIPTITTTADAAHVVTMVTAKDPGSANGGPSTNWTGSAAYTERDDWHDSLNAAAAGAAADQAAPTAGQYGGGTWASDNAGVAISTSKVVTYVVALAPLTASTKVRPTTDVTTAGWSATPALSAGEQNAARLADGSDASYLTSPTDPSGSILEVRLPLLSGPPSQLRTRVAAAGGASSMSVTTKLMQAAVEIASFGPETAVVTAPTMYTYALSQAQQDAITDLSDLRIRTVATVA